MRTLLFICAVSVYSSAVAQSTWHKIATGTTKKLNTIDFPSSKVGYIGGDDSTLLKSTDGGLTWNQISFTGVPPNLGGKHVLDLDFVNDSVGFMAIGPYNGAYKTTDGGASWTHITTAGNLCFTRSLYFFDAQNGLLGGSGCFQGENIEKMISGTMSITTINHPTWDNQHMVADFDFLNTNFGLAASIGGNILRTTDGGMNWDSIPSGKDSNVPLTSVAVINNTLAYAGYNDPGNGYGLLVTSDGGLTWVDDLSSATFFYPAWLCLHEAGNGTIYSGAQPGAGVKGPIFESTSTGWLFSNVDQPINAMTSYANVVFGVGDSGYVVTNKLLLTQSMEKWKNSPPFTIYPNPASDILKIISNTEEKGQAAVLIIYSSTGELIRELSYTEGEAIDISSLVAGIYFFEFNGMDQLQRWKVIKE